ncbi:hypothetical protein HDU98_003064 [Podochytrium sp. JEL0797]|nr:hypothetical protein HDU98_003064 [Podochytrium sp. JEL0797]
MTSSAATRRDEMEKKKDSARFQDAVNVAANYAWLDRMAKEMKARHEWSDKWGALNDPKLYLGESGPDKFPTKAPVSSIAYDLS